MATRRPVKAAKQAANPPTAKGNPDRLEITDPRFVDPVKRGAMLASSPLVRGAVASLKYSEVIFGADTDLTAYLAELRARADAVQRGRMKGLETMLVTQANTLDMMFNHLARKAAFSEYLNQMQAHLSLALKAQAQCRATVEAIAEIRNPRPVAFVKQANIANGPQQVNNGSAPPQSRAHAEESTKPTNELLTDDHGTTLDRGTEGQAGRGNPALETVGKRNGAAHRGGEGFIRQQCNATRHGVCPLAGRPARTERTAARVQKAARALNLPVGKKCSRVSDAAISKVTGCRRRGSFEAARLRPEDVCITAPSLHQ